MFNYLKFSNLKVFIDFNPFTWGFQFKHQEPTKTDPHLSITFLKILGLGVILVIDDGKHIPWEEEIVPNETGNDRL